MTDPFFIDPDIHKAETLPSHFYTSSEIIEIAKEKIFAPSWQWIIDYNVSQKTHSIFPFSFLEDFINESLLLTNDLSGTIHCISNVCTHRANLLVAAPENKKKSSVTITDVHSS